MPDRIECRLLRDANDLFLYFWRARIRRPLHLKCERDLLSVRGEFAGTAQTLSEGAVSRLRMQVPNRPASVTDVFLDAITQACETLLEPRYRRELVGQRIELESHCHKALEQSVVNLTPKT